MIWQSEAINPSVQLALGKAMLSKLETGMYVCLHMIICICTVATYILIQVMIPALCVYTLGHTLTIYWNVSQEKMFAKVLKLAQTEIFTVIV